jgi:hypothetical protein
MVKTAFQLDASGLVVNAVVLTDDANPADFGVVSGPEHVGIGWWFVDGVWMPPQQPPATLDDLRAAKVRDIEARAEARLSIGAPVSDGLHIALDDGSRADLTAMAATATAAASGAVTWPASYSRGWITVENTRIPLPVPAAGLALAAVVGDWYARVVQHRRDLKDQVLAAADEAALAAIDITAGWPA